MELRHKPTDLSRGGAQEAGIPIVRRVVMFPLTRLLIAMGMFIGLLLLLGYGAMRLMGEDPQDSTAEFLLTMVSALAALIVFVFVAKVIERRPLAADGLGKQGVVSGTTKGFAIGAGMMSAVIGVLAFAGWYSVTSVAWQQPGVWLSLLGALGGLLAVSVSEEVLFRGVLFRIIEEGLGSWLALAIAALFFGGAHLANPNATLLGALGVALSGILLAAAYMLTRSLWLAIGLHWSWNFFEGSVFGAAVSGNDYGSSPIQATISGPELWAGGAFGPEAGLVGYIITAVASVVILALVVKRGGIIVPRWMRRSCGKRAVQS